MYKICEQMVSVMGLHKDAEVTSMDFDPVFTPESHWTMEIQSQSRVNTVWEF